MHCDSRFGAVSRCEADLMVAVVMWKELAGHVEVVARSLLVAPACKDGALARQLGRFG